MALQHWAANVGGFLDRGIENSTDLLQLGVLIETAVNEPDKFGEMMEGFKNLSKDQLFDIFTQDFQDLANSATPEHKKEYILGKLVFDVGSTLATGGGILKAGSLLVATVKKGSRLIKDIPDNVRDALLKKLDGKYKLDGDELEFDDVDGMGKKVRDFLDDYDNSPELKKLVDEVLFKKINPDDATEDLFEKWQNLNEILKKSDPEEILDLSLDKYKKVSQHVLEGLKELSPGKAHLIPGRNTIEKLIRHQDNEWAIAYKPDGTPIGIEKGNGNGTTAKVPDGAEGGIVTHNHPLSNIIIDGLKEDATFKGASFSIADMREAGKHGLKEIRATPTGQKHTFVLRRKDGSTFDNEIIDDLPEGSILDILTETLSGQKSNGLEEILNARKADIGAENWQKLIEADMIAYRHLNLDREEVIAQLERQLVSGECS